MHRSQWLKCVSVICMLIIWSGATCPPGFECSGPECYLIYSENGDWKFRDPEGNTRDAGRPVYNESNCYKFIKVSNQQRSCIDAQRECELVGGNITVINSVEEYNQLTDNVLDVLSAPSLNTFNVHVESELPQKNLNKGCAIIDVYDGVLYPNTVKSENMNCSATDEINTIVCESTDLTPGICQEVNSTEITTSRLDLTTSRLDLTKNVNATVSNANSFTNTPNNLLQTTPWYELDKCHGLVVDIIIVLSTVIITIVVMCFLIFLRNKLKTSGRKHGRDSYSDGKSINQDTHQNELYQLSSQKHGVVVPSNDQSELYHDTVVPPVDSGASVPLYHDTVVPPVNSAAVPLYHDTVVPPVDSGASVPLYHDIVVPAKSEQCVDDPNSSYIEIIN